MKFSLKSEVTAKIRDPKSGRATGQTKEALQLIRYLDSIKGQMISHYHRLYEANEVVTAAMVRDACLGTDISLFEEFNDRRRKLSVSTSPNPLSALTEKDIVKESKAATLYAKIR